MYNRHRNLAVILLILSLGVIAFEVSTHQPNNESNLQTPPTELKIESSDTNEEVNIEPIANTETEEDAQNCSQNFAPVCGITENEKQTFNNSCEAEKVGASQITEGLCDILESCPTEYQPVCAYLNNEAQTFFNQCEAANAGAIHAMNGACESMACNKELKPVCAKIEEVQTRFNNECFANEAGATEIVSGECPEIIPTETEAPTTLDE